MKILTQFLVGLLLGTMLLTSCNKNDVSFKMRGKLSGTWVCTSSVSENGIVNNRYPYSITNAYDQGFRIKRNGAARYVDMLPNDVEEVRSDSELTWDYNESTNILTIGEPGNTAQFTVTEVDKDKMILTTVSGTLIEGQLTFESR